MSRESPSTLQFPCPGCSNRLQVRAGTGGKSGTCPKCGTRFTVPVAGDGPILNQKVFDLDETVATGSAPKPVPRRQAGTPDPAPSSNRSLLLIGVGLSAAAFLVATVLAAVVFLGGPDQDEASVDASTPENTSQPSEHKAPGGQVPGAGITQDAGSHPSTPAAGTAVPSSTVQKEPSGQDTSPKVEEPVPSPPEPVRRPPPPVATRPAPVNRAAAIDAALSRVKSAAAYIQGRYGRGSGFLIAPNIVATNSHVVLCDLMEDVTVRFMSNDLLEKKGYGVELLYEDKARDLVLLKLDESPGRNPLKVSSTFRTNGRPSVYVVGSPAQPNPGSALLNVVEKASCDEEIEQIGGQPFYRLRFAADRTNDVRIGPGNSGGAVVDEKGEVIGVLTLGEFSVADGRPTGKANCIPYRAMHSAMTEIGRPEQWKEAAAGATARHALDIAMICYHADVLLASVLIQARTDFVTRERDEALRQAFNTSDRKIAERGAPAMKILRDGTELTPAQAAQLRNMRQSLDDLRITVKKTRFTQADYDRARKAERVCLNAFAKLSEESRMSGEFIDMMRTTILAQTGVRIERTKP